MNLNGIYSRQFIKQIFFSCLLLQFLSMRLHADFFQLEMGRPILHVPADKLGVWHDQYVDPKAPPVKKPLPATYLPSLEVKLRSQEIVASKDAYVRAYFFDENKNLIRSCSQPARVGITASGFMSAPVFFKPDTPSRIFFQIPKELLGSNWHAVVVFGDKNEASATAYPTTDLPSSFTYPEKALVEDPFHKNVKHKVTLDPLIESHIKSNVKNSKYPDMTLFLRLPSGVSDPKDLQGVLAICVLAFGIDKMRHDLQQPELSGDYCGLYQYANTHKLAIVAWGVPTPNWNIMQNYNEMVQKFFLSMEGASDDIANTWEKGVLELTEKYGIPKKDYLLWGVCGAAQWAQRLCVRKPDYFLATYMLIPCSFDKPRPEASKVLWCLCTGELFGGYENSQRWYAESRKMNYPIFYKAYEGLGHASSGVSLGMAFKFFDFALTQKDLRDQYDAMQANRFASIQYANSGNAEGPWPEAFKHPAYYGDIINQEIYPADQVEMIPPGFRTPLPTKELADYWMRTK
jgi:hypothetical protein